MSGSISFSILFVVFPILLFFPNPFRASAGDPGPPGHEAPSEGHARQEPGKMLEPAAAKYLGYQAKHKFERRKTLKEGGTGWSLTS